MKNRIQSFIGLSLEQAPNLLTDRDLRLFYLVWPWLNLRISSHTQDSYHRKHGFAALVNRINRFRKALNLKEI